MSRRSHLSAQRVQLTLEMCLPNLAVRPRSFAPDATPVSPSSISASGASCSLEPSAQGPSPLPRQASAKPQVDQRDKVVASTVRDEGGLPDDGITSSPLIPRATRVEESARVTPEEQRKEETRRRRCSLKSPRHRKPSPRKSPKSPLRANTQDDVQDKDGTRKGDGDAYERPPVAPVEVEVADPVVATPDDAASAKIDGEGSTSSQPEGGETPERGFRRLRKAKGRKAIAINQLPQITDEEQATPTRDQHSQCCDAPHAPASHRDASVAPAQVDTRSCRANDKAEGEAKQPKRTRQSTLDGSRSAVETCDAIQRRVAKLNRAQAKVYHALLALLTTFMATRSSDYAAGLGFGWDALTWHLTIVRMAHRMGNEPRDLQRDCWLLHERYDDTRLHVTPVTCERRHPSQGTRLHGVSEGDEHWPSLHRLATVLRYPRRIKSLQLGLRRVQGAHRCMHETIPGADANPCFNPWHMVLASDIVNKGMRACNNGCALTCPHEPKCVWTDERGIHLPCRTLVEGIPGVCEHEPNCWDRPPGRRYTERQVRFLVESDGEDEQLAEMDERDLDSEKEEEGEEGAEKVRKRSRRKRKRHAREEEGEGKDEEGKKGDVEDVADEEEKATERLRKRKKDKASALRSGLFELLRRKASAKFAKKTGPETTPNEEGNVTDGGTTSD